jgi:hypothetical protein
MNSLVRKELIALSSDLFRQIWPPDPLELPLLPSLPPNAACHRQQRALYMDVPGLSTLVSHSSP